MIEQIDRLAWDDLRVTPEQTLPPGSTGGGQPPDPPKAPAAAWNSTISLGIGQVGVGMLRDLRGCLAASDRDVPLSPGANCTPIAR